MRGGRGTEGEERKGIGVIVCEEGKGKGRGGKERKGIGVIVCEEGRGIRRRE